MKIVRMLLTVLVCTVCGSFAFAQGQENGDPVADGTAAVKPATPATTPVTTPGSILNPSLEDDKHILGVVPNYATVNEPTKTYHPATVGEKFSFAAHDSFDPYNWVLAGVYAAVYQKQDQYSSFGQGATGYAKRYGAVFADGAISTYITEAILPSMLHEDPRYFRLGEGGKWKRIGYALTRVLVTKTDSGGQRFNNSEIFGNMGAAAIGNLYYPSVNRTAEETAERFGISVISDAGFNVLKEFWPDMRRKILHR